MNTTKNYTSVKLKRNILIYILIFIISFSIFLISIGNVVSLIPTLCSAFAVLLTIIPKVVIKNDAVEITYGLIPYIQTKKIIPINDITEVNITKDKSDKPKSVRIDYALKSGNTSFIVLKKYDISDIKDFTNEILKRR